MRLKRGGGKKKRENNNNNNNNVCDQCSKTSHLYIKSGQKKKWKRKSRSGEEKAVSAFLSQRWQK